MSFNQAKTYDVVITEAYIAEPKFKHSLCDVALKVETEEGEHDFYSMEVSGNYGKGNYATMTQSEITLKKLRELGLKAETIEEAFSNLETLVGTKTSATVKLTEKDGKTYYNISFLGSGYAPKKLDPKEALNRISQLFAEEKPATAASAGGSKANPFL